MENSIGSVVIEILSNRQKTLLLYIMRLSNKDKEEFYHKKSIIQGP